MKKSFLSMLFLFSLFIALLSGCSGDADVPEPTPLPEQEPPADTVEHIELNPEILIDGVTYIFEGGTEEKKQNLAMGAGAMLSKASAEYGLSRVPFKVTFTQGGEASITSNTISYNPDDPYALGAEFFFASRQTLPAWLSAGLELYWMDQVDLLQFEIDLNTNAALNNSSQIPSDEWFISGFLEDGLSSKELMILHGFIAHLEQAGILNELISLYMSDTTREQAELLWAGEWENLTSNKVDVSEVYQYLYGNGVVVRTARGTYRFEAAEWTSKILADKVALMERGIAYAYGWFGMEQEKPVPVRIHIRENENDGVVGGLGGRNGVDLYGTISHSPYKITHEVTHHIQFSTPLRGGFALYMPEGLADAVSFHQAMDDEVYRKSFLESSYHRGYISMRPPAMQPIIRELPGIEISPEGAIEVLSVAKLDALIFTAYMELYQKAPNLSQKGLLRTSPMRPQDRVDGLLYTYPTAAAFSLFLLELGSKEDYLRFYMDQNLAEEIYGKDFETLIDIWLHEYLEVDSHLEPFYQYLESAEQ